MFFPRIIILFGLLSITQQAAAARWISITINNDSSHEIEMPKELLLPIPTWNGRLLFPTTVTKIKPGAEISLTTFVAVKKDLSLVFRRIFYTEALADDEELYSNMVINKIKEIIPATYDNQEVFITITEDEILTSIENICYWAPEQPKIAGFLMPASKA